MTEEGRLYVSCCMQVYPESAVKVVLGFTEGNRDTELGKWGFEGYQRAPASSPLPSTYSRAYSSRSCRMTF
jgi:hypothetical protein